MRSERLEENTQGYLYFIVITATHLCVISLCCYHRFQGYVAEVTVIMMWRNITGGVWALVRIIHCFNFSDNLDAACIFQWQDLRILVRHMTCALLLVCS